MFHRCIACQFHKFPASSCRMRITKRMESTLSYFAESSPSNEDHSQRHAAFMSALDHPFSQVSARMFSSPSFTKPARRSKRKFVPRKAAVQLTEKAREFFKLLLKNSPEKAGIILNYQQASSGQPRMVFSFGFVTKDQLAPEDEGVSLEVLEDGTPKSPKDSEDDGLPKLYIQQNAFLKVLGATLDVNTENVTPILYDREGNVMDPNA